MKLSHALLPQRSSLPFPLLLALFALVAPLGLFGQALATGAIEGRVFNATNARALVNARVSLVGTSIETTTDESGFFHLSKVPTGQARLQVSFIGMESQSASVDVSAGATVQRDFDLKLITSSRSMQGDVIELETFTVVEDREMSAQAVAMNEQRSAPNLKNVVAIDEFGDRGNENIGEFLLFLPGVSIETSGAEPNAVSLRGFPSNNSSINVDGGALANSFNVNSRSLDLREVPMNNISRVEVTKVPTPDVPATSLGGSINLVSRSGLETKKRKFSYNAYTLFHNRSGLTFDGGPRNNVPGNSPRFIQPSFDFNYLHPINRKLAITIGGARVWRLKPMETGFDTDETADWNLVNLFQRQSQWQSLAQIFRTASGQVGLDWRISSKDSLSASFQYRDYNLYMTRSVLTFNYGTGATGGPTYTQGASNGVGTVSMNNSGENSNITTISRHATLRYRHIGSAWRLESSGSFSASRLSRPDIDCGFFNMAPASITNLVIRGDNIPSSGGIIPTAYSAKTRTGADVDLYDGGNYSFDRGTSNQGRWNTQRQTGRADLTKDFTGALPFTIKTGLAVDNTERDQRRYPKTWNFRPNGASDAASRLAGKYELFDSDFDADAPTLYGRPVRWVSGMKAYELFQAHPEWFVLDEPLAHQDMVNNSRRFLETISAAYLRADLKLLGSRLWLVGGARYERTDAEGWGPLNDINAQYQRNPDGSFVRNAAGQKVLITSDTLALRKLRYQERGAYGKQNYDGLYPSLNATYTLTENLVLRAAYARSLGRPNVNFVIPGTTISDPDSSNPTITVNNTALKPWTADNFDLTLESYNFKDGFGSIGVFQKNIKNFFEAVNTQATPELLEYYDLAGDPSLLNYQISTRSNGGDAKITGVEFGYRQSLTFLPKWARGLQVFVNATKLNLSGSNTADFSGYNPESVSGGINLVRPRFFIKATVSYLGDTKLGLVSVSTANGIPADTYNYQAKRTRYAVNAQYSLSRRCSLYASITDIGGFVWDRQRYAPNTPDYAKYYRRQESGFYTSLGVRGEF